ncbi:hypothetical protein GY45DRAFT_1374823 [Cubamyces sp. BRFM 1775]|nr:hypothetical protein GY45DRAFT_1374823 [Cubamyces sp. BRFM 1775]
MSFDIIILISAAVFSALRVFALWDRNPWIFSSVLILGMVNPAISIYTFTQTQPFMYSIPTGSCGFDNSVIPENEYEKVLLVTNVIGLILSRKIELVQPVTAFIGLLTSIFMSHFILDLHEAANVHAHENATMQVSGLSTVTSIVFHNYPDGPPRGQTRSRSTSCSVYGARLTHISASDDWDEPQDNVEDTTMAGSPAKEPRFS